MSIQTTPLTPPPRSMARGSSRYRLWLSIYLGMLLVLPPASLPLAQPAEPVRILPLGDSITQGAPYSYRYDLWQRLIDAGWNFDFIGLEQESNPGPFPDYQGQSFDRDHEGHSGWTNALILQNLAEWLAAYPAPPDMTLIHLGTNDAVGGGTPAASVATLEAIIDQLRASNPNMTIYLAQIIPFGSALGDVNIWVEEYNAQLVELATRKTTLSSRVIIVNHYSGFTDADLTSDAVHPSRQGVQKMAAVWAAALFTPRELPRVPLPLLIVGDTPAPTPDIPLQETTAQPQHAAATPLASGCHQQ